LEQVMVTGSGVTRHPLFFLDYFRKPVKKQVKTSMSEGLELVPNPAQVRCSYIKHFSNVWF